MDIEWTKPVETYGELKGYRVRYGLRGQRLTEILITDPEVQHQVCANLIAMRDGFRAGDSGYRCNCKCQPMGPGPSYWRIMRRVFSVMVFCVVSCVVHKCYFGFFTLLS